jgi:hypothetical protein
MSKAAYRDIVIEVVRKLTHKQGFQPLSRRWGREDIWLDDVLASAEARLQTAPRCLLSGQIDVAMSGPLSCRISC